MEHDDEMREQLEGICEHCGKVFTYYLVHCGFSDSSYAYCDTCGSTALLSLWSPTYPVSVGTLPKGDPFQEISAEWEQYLRPCGCGGRFKKGATPRCPNCNRQLSPELAANYIEKNATGAKKGWQWQRSWSALYCIVIANKLVEDNFVSS